MILQLYPGRKSRAVTTLRGALVENSMARTTVFKKEYRSFLKK